MYPETALHEASKICVICPQNVQTLRKNLRKKKRDTKIWMTIIENPSNSKLFLPN